MSILSASTSDNGITVQHSSGSSNGPKNAFSTIAAVFKSKRAKKAAAATAAADRETKLSPLSSSEDLTLSYARSSQDTLVSAKDPVRRSKKSSSPAPSAFDLAEHERFLQRALDLC